MQSVLPLQVPLQFDSLRRVLVVRLLDQHQLAVGHHGKATGRRENFIHIRVATVEHGFIEILESLVHHRVQEGLHNFRDEEGLLAVQYVNRRELFRSDVAYDLAMRHVHEGTALRSRFVAWIPQCLR